MGQKFLIELDKVSKSYGSLCAISSLDLRVARGEIVGILGPNGAGKSTAMRLAVGFIPSDSGKISLANYDVAREPLPARKTLGYLPEGMPLWGSMRVLAFLRNIAALRGVARAKRSSVISRVVSDLSLQDVLNRPIDVLSKGYRRRVGLAQALLHDPAVLILDEPTDGLDPNQKHTLRAMIRAISPRKGILLSTHALDEVEALCDRVLILHRGRVVATGSPRELAAKAPKQGVGSALERAFRAATV